MDTLSAGFIAIVAAVVTSVISYYFQSRRDLKQALRAEEDWLRDTRLRVYGDFYRQIVERLAHRTSEGQSLYFQS